MRSICTFLRDPKDASDKASVHKATLKALIRMEEYKFTEYDIVVQLMPNCPCKNHLDIVRACNDFESMKAMLQISVFKFGWMNHWWAMSVDKKMMRTRPLLPQAMKKI